MLVLTHALVCTQRCRAAFEQVLGGTFRGSKSPRVRECFGWTVDGRRFKMVQTDNIREGLVIRRHCYISHSMTQYPPITWTTVALRMLNEYGVFDFFAGFFGGLPGYVVAIICANETSWISQRESVCVCV